MIIKNLEPLLHKEESFARTFVDTGAANEFGYNLTELRPATDAYAQNYDDDSQALGFSNHADWESFTRIYAFVGKQLAKVKPDAWLDVGCGELQLTFFLNKNRFKPRPGTKYFGIELRATEDWLTALAPSGNAKNRYKADMTLIRGDVVKSDFTAVPGWPSSGFKFIVMTEVFEHLPRSAGVEMMERLYSWTAPGGICIFSTPNAGVSVSTAENHTDPVSGESREWTYADKLALFEQVGFKVEKSYGRFTGSTYLPPEARAHFESDPIWKSIKEYYSGALWSCLISTHYPEHSVASLQVLRRPA